MLHSSLLTACSRGPRTAAGGGDGSPILVRPSLGGKEASLTWESAPRTPSPPPPTRATVVTHFPLEFRFSPLKWP